MQTSLSAQARARGVHVQVEFHKRWDPMYADARARMRALGDCSYFQSFMSQPKFQLDVCFHSSLLLCKSFYILQFVTVCISRET